MRRGRTGAPPCGAEFKRDGKIGRWPEKSRRKSFADVHQAQKTMSVVDETTMSDMCVPRVERVASLIKSSEVSLTESRRLTTDSSV